ncbi:MAG: TonB family protein [Gammaproteobacteria bacterium]
MNRRDAAIWALAGGGSLLLHLALFVHTGSRFGADAPPARPRPSVTRLSFLPVSTPQPKSTPAPQTVSKPNPTGKPPPPGPRPELKPRPARPAKPKPSPAPQPTPEPAPPPQPNAASAPQLSPAAAPPGPAAGAAPKQDPQLVQKARQAYLVRLLAHIEAHKRYPRAARRRGIEGRVHVAFRLLDGGNVAQLQATGARHLLRKEAAKAVRDAVPLPPPPPGISLPMPVSFDMVFALR